MWKEFCKKLFKKMEFYFQSNSVMNSLKCPKSKSLSHCLTELFPIYQNKHWTIRWQDDSSVNPSSHRIMLKIVGFLKKTGNHKTDKQTTNSETTNTNSTRNFFTKRMKINGIPRARDQNFFFLFTSKVSVGLVPLLWPQSTME